MSGTVTVQTWDLYRLLLTFRSLAEASGREWSHMVDYDQSFERLADAVEADRRKPDPRTRCNHTSSCYLWPQVREVQPVNVRSASLAGTPGRLQHLAYRAGERDGRLYHALCGFGFAQEDTVKKPTTPYPLCPVCDRESKLRVPPGPEAQPAAGAA